MRNNTNTLSRDFFAAFIAENFAAFIAESVCEKQILTPIFATDSLQILALELTAQARLHAWETP
jgi:fructose-specific phosphotransferase system IIC component